MTPDDEFIRVGAWLVRRSAVDAIGPSQVKDAEYICVLRSGRALTLTRDEAVAAERELAGESDWRK